MNQLPHGQLHWLGDVYAIGDKLYSNTISENVQIKVAYETTITVYSAYDWKNGAWEQRTLSAEKQYDSAFLHKRHITSGYSHIVGDECFPMFYLLAKNRIEVEGIINVPNLERTTQMDWVETLEKLTPFNVLESYNFEIGAASAYIRNAYSGWQTNSITMKDKTFDYTRYSSAVIRRLGVEDNFNKGKIIFEVREQDARRKILNIDELKEGLSSFNIEFVNFAKMSTKEQLDKVYNANILIGQHGAGLTNGIFMRRNTKIVEILPEDYSDYGAYLCFAQMFGVNYIKYVVPKENCVAKEDIKDKNSRQYKRDQDITINLKDFKKILTQICNTKD